MKSISLADQVFEHLENDIVTGVFPRGEVLTELGLSERLNVSRTPIREALHRLEQEHLVQTSGKGMVVMGITCEDLEDIMNIRLHVEGVAARYAALHLDENGRAKLTNLVELQDFYTERKDIDHLRQIDDELHETIYELSGRLVLMDVLRPLHLKALRYRRQAIAQRSVRSTAEHKAICRAILAGEAEKAERLMTQHIQNTKTNMIKGLKDHGTDNR